MFSLGERVFTLVDETAADGVEFELYKTGMICATAQKEAQKVLDGLEPMRAFGFQLPDTLMTGEELHAFEPALSERVQAGFHVEQQWHVRANTFTEGLARRVAELGAEIAERPRCTGSRPGTGVCVLCVPRSRRRRLPRRRLVDHGAQLGLRLPTDAGKGYTLAMLKYGILFADIRGGASPTGCALTMEFSGYNLELDQRRIDNVFRLASEYLRLEQPSCVGGPAADGRGRAADPRSGGPRQNAYVATGYSMLGMTLPAGRGSDGRDAGQRSATGGLRALPDRPLSGAWSSGALGG